MGDREIEIETDGPFTKKNIVLTRSTIVCKRKAKPIWCPFLGRIEAVIGKDIIPSATGANRFIYPPEYLGALPRG